MVKQSYKTLRSIGKMVEQTLLLASVAVSSKKSIKLLQNSCWRWFGEVRLKCIDYPSESIPLRQQ
jgi:hypothetical protein